MNLREKKGSIAIFVLIALLFMASFLIIMFSGNINKSKIVKEQIDIIRQIYGKSVKRLEEIEDILSAIPEIKFEISEITGGVKNIKITTNGITEAPYIEEYKIDNEIKTSKEEFYEYVNAYVEDGVEKEVSVTITNDIRNTSTITQEVKFVRPNIKELPEEIIVETVDTTETYVEYDEAGGTTEYIAFDQTFTNFEKLINYVKDNNEYEKVDLIVNAKGNNFLNSTAHYSVTFLTNAEPEIKDLPKEIWVGYTEVADSYVVYNYVEKETETYKIVKVPEETFSTMTELVEFAAGYLLENNISKIDADIKVIAKGKNNTEVESVQTITFKLPRIEIQELPKEIWVNYTEVADSYVVYNYVEKEKETYTITIVELNETYNTMTKVVEYAYNWLVRNNQNEVTVNINIVANGTNNTKSESTQQVTFKLPLKPVIGTLPTSLITGVTPVNDSYVTYDELGSQKETYTITIVELNETYNTMTELVDRAAEWLLDNETYEVEAHVKVETTGVTNLSSESTQLIKFVRGSNVTSEADLINALSSPVPSYIQISDDITFTEDINIDGVTHTLDLNGKTMSRTTTNENFTLLTIGPGANITISDTSANQDGKILAAILETTESIGESIENSITCIKNFGELTIEPGINIVAEGKVIMEKAKKNTAVDITTTAITNDGILNLNGGTVYASTITQACSNTLIRNSRATAYGINSSGIVNLNSGSITANAEAYAVKASITNGQNFATAYGIRNNDGTVNGNGVIFKTTAHADKSNATITDYDEKDIKNI